MIDNRIDEELYQGFRELFPEMNVEVIDEDHMKSPAEKEKWRPFLMSFEKRLEQFNFATLLRLNAKLEYDPDNTIIGKLLALVTIGNCSHLTQTLFITNYQFLEHSFIVLKLLVIERVPIMDRTGDRNKAWNHVLLVQEGTFIFGRFVKNTILHIPLSTNYND